LKQVLDIVGVSVTVVLQTSLSVHNRKVASGTTAAGPQFGRIDAASIVLTCRDVSSREDVGRACDGAESGAGEAPEVLRPHPRGVGQKLRVGRTTVQRWELGETEPQPWQRPRLAKELGVSAERLDYLLSGGETDDVDLEAARMGGQDQPESDDMRRRELLRLFSMVGTLVAMPAIDPDRMAYAADHPAQLDLTTLDDYTELNSHLWRAFALAPSKSDVKPLVRHQLDLLCAGLRHQHDDAVRHRLLVLIGDLMQLAGEIFFDGTDYTEAAHCYTLAADASKAAKAYDLWACAMVRHSFVSLYERQFSDAAPMLDLAAAVAHHGDTSLSTRHWVSGGV
jgi:hypothetical protein